MHYFSQLKESTLSRFYSGNFHFNIIFICFLFQTLTFGKPNRLFAWINLVIVTASLTYSLRPYFLKHLKASLQIILFPLLFISIHFLALSDWIFNKEIQQILLATGLVLGVWQLALKDFTYDNKKLFSYGFALLLLYAAFQVIAIYVLNRPYGTTKNPHYLAMYSATLMIIAFVMFNRACGVYRWAILCIFLLLGALLLNTSSRPTWIGLILASFMMGFFLKKQSKIWAFTAIAFVLAGLSLSNLANFQSKFDDLLVHLDTEERVTIWRDVWEMQTQSNLKQWVVGHGLDSFKESFKPYSHYHLKNIDYNSPHNFILELVFVSGVLGLFIFSLMLYFIYHQLLVGIRLEDEHKPIYLALFAILTTNLAMIGITQPVFSTSNLNIIGLVTGVVLFLKAKQTET